MTILMQNWEPRFTRCGYIPLSDLETGALLVAPQRCGAEATVAEIRYDDWNYCFMRCAQHQGLSLDRMFTYITVPASKAARVQLRMACIKLLDREMLVEGKQEKRWLALAESKAILYQSLFDFLQETIWEDQE